MPAEGQGPHCDAVDRSRQNRYRSRPQSTVESSSPSLLATKRALSADTLGQSHVTYSKRIKATLNDYEGLSGGTDTQPLTLAPPGLRSSSPSDFSFLEAATTMLRRAEDTGGNKVVRLARGTQGSPAPSRSSPRPSSQHSYDHRSPRGTRLFQSVALAELLQQDERPIFVIDLLPEEEEQEREEDDGPGDDEPGTGDGLRLLFANHALRARPQLLDCVEGRSEDAALLLDLGTPFVDFKSWLFSPLRQSDMVPTFPFAGVMWKFATVRKQLRVVTAISDHANLEPQRPSMSVFKGLGGSSSTLMTHRASPENSGYFELKPGFTNSDTPSRIDGPPKSSLSATATPSTQPEATSMSDITGDVGISDLLASNISPSRDQQHVRSYIASANPERLESMSMDYLSDKGFFDWTRLPMAPTLPEHIRFARNVDWGATSLGAIEEWPADLRAMCNLIMASPHPAAMYWGSDHVIIYNEAYIVLAGQKHPSLMGMRYEDAWAEIWAHISDVFAVAESSAQATMRDDDCLFIRRNGFLEETYFSWSIIPLIGDDGSVVGLYNPAFEKTRRKIAERRMLTLREIGERTAAARAVSQFWSLLVEGLLYNEYDAPLVILYSLVDGDDSDAASSASSTAAASKVCRLEGALGVEPGHPAAPQEIDLKHDNQGFARIFKQAINAEKPIVLSAEDGTLDQRLLEGVKWRGYGDPSRIVVVSPVRPTSGESTLGFLVMGTNPRRPYDEDYDLFVQLLGRQLATSVASVVLFEEEIRKGERAARMAAQDRIELSNQLAARTAEAVESENKFTRMAELAPVGMYIGDADGKIQFANDAWYRISSFPRDMPIDNRWIEYVNEEDQQSAWGIWKKMMETKNPVSIEFRFRTPWQDKPDAASQTWVIASASPELDGEGNVKRVFGSITDISSQKYAEALQKRRVEEAVQMKRAQERYIDTTSHEMRNPLSAILQSADSITSSLTDLMVAAPELAEPHRELLDTTIDSAQTITLCAQHQKRIVDDVLTLSKLDSAMLLVTPVDAQPVAVVRRALKMFEGELQTADITLDFRIDQSYHNLDVDWVRLDPTRLSQVLINLTTNAIKFTTTQDKRTIRMHVAASKERPSQEDKWKLTYIPTQVSRVVDVTAAAEWGLGDPVYLHFAVQDTGRGLTESERKQLFQRFSQANPRTHVTYGGSGLGLFISRELVELQGGEIGVASEAGKGSTFAFYVKARRSHAPMEGSEDEVASDGFSHRKGSRSSGLHVKSSSKLGVYSQLAHSPSTSVSPSNHVGISPETLKVLVVEDNLINQKVLAAQLRKIGCVVYVANHGVEAIDQIKQSTFYHAPKPHPSTKELKQPIEISVVLMDLEMPVMDGQTCARELRKMQKSGALKRHIPVIAVTANAREEQIRETLSAGIDDVVSKPFRIVELVPKMRDVISRFGDNGGSTNPVKTGGNRNGSPISDDVAVDSSSSN